MPIGMRPPEPPKQKAKTGEDKAEEVSFLVVLDEPPEGVGSYSKGGSSGSRAAPPAPEAVGSYSEGGSSGSREEPLPP